MLYNCEGVFVMHPADLIGRRCKCVLRIGE